MSRQPVIPERCRRASYTMTAAVAAAFNDSTGGSIGILTRSSAAAKISGGNPGPSPPIRMAVGPRRSASNKRRPPRGAVATMRNPSRRNSSTSAPGAAPVLLLITGIRKALPMEPRRAFNPNGSAEAPEIITPAAPPASATRMIAPTFPGSCTFTATMMRGARAVAAGFPCVAAAPTLAGPPTRSGSCGTTRLKTPLSSRRGRSASATIALDERTPLSAAITGAATETTSTPPLMRRFTSPRTTGSSIDAAATAASRT